MEFPFDAENPSKGLTICSVWMCKNVKRVPKKAVKDAISFFFILFFVLQGGAFAR